MHQIAELRNRQADHYLKIRDTIAIIILSKRIRRFKELIGSKLCIEFFDSSETFQLLLYPSPAFCLITP